MYICMYMIFLSRHDTRQILSKLGVNKNKRVNHYWPQKYNKIFFLFFRWKPWCKCNAIFSFLFVKNVVAFTDFFLFRYLFNFAKYKEIRFQSFNWKTVIEEVLLLNAVLTDLKTYVHILEALHYLFIFNYTRFYFIICPLPRASWALIYGEYYFLRLITKSNF